MCLCACVCVRALMLISPRQSRGYDTSPLMRRKSYDRAYRYVHCHDYLSLPSVLKLISLLFPSWPSVFSSGPLMATRPPPPLLWGPGMTAMSSQGSPATKPKVLLWTSEFFLFSFGPFFPPHTLELSRVSGSLFRSHSQKVRCISVSPLYPMWASNQSSPLDI